MDKAKAFLPRRRMLFTFGFEISRPAWLALQERLGKIFSKAVTQCIRLSFDCLLAFVPESNRKAQRQGRLAFGSLLGINLSSVETPIEPATTAELQNRETVLPIEFVCGLKIGSSSSWGTAAAKIRLGGARAGSIERNRFGERAETMNQHWKYSQGVKDVGNGLFAYLQPGGGWGWSNAGLITDGDQSLLVDTLFDMTLTSEMLDAMKDAAGVAGSDIGTIVNTHANGDHTHGNGCCPQAEIVASKASAAEMEAFGAAAMTQLMQLAPTMGKAGEYFAEIFAPFDFAGVQQRLPTRTFSGRLDLKVGDRRVELIEVGPAHTAGDVLVHVPDSRTVFTGDVLFIQSTPIMWAGPVSNWIEACDKILAMNADVIVPGHGPITDNDGVRAVQSYLRYVDQQARKRFDAGLPLRDAIHDIALGDFSSWGDAERIAVNVLTLYREYEGKLAERVNPLELFALMAEVRDCQKSRKQSVK